MFGMAMLGRESQGSSKQVWVWKSREWQDLARPGKSRQLVADLGLDQREVTGFGTAIKVKAARSMIGPDDVGLGDVWQCLDRRFKAAHGETRH